MTFTHLSIILIIFFLIFPAQLRKPENFDYYNDHQKKVWSKMTKIYYFLNLLVIGFYLAAFILISFYPDLYKKAV